MTTQVFRARTLADAQVAAKDALGDEAVILTTRQIPRTGIGGLFGQRDVEVAAAVVSTPVPPAQSMRVSKRPANAMFATAAYMEEEPKAPADPLASLRAEVRGELRSMKVSLGRQSAAPGKVERDTLASELAAMRALVEELAPLANASGGRTFEARPPMLRASGIEGGAATILARALRAPGAKDNQEEAFCNALQDLVRVTQWPLTDQGRSIVSLVGPTGVGKTTTLAKIAAKAVMDGRTVTLITCDTFRVGGVEQTKRYAELLECPWTAAHDADELERAINGATTDLILVDTSGRAPDDCAAEGLLADKDFLDRMADKKIAVRVHLCMTASTRSKDAARIVETFRTADPTALAITKIDETDVPSGLVHAVHASGLPIALTTAGQRVPEDISPATKGAILDAFTRKASVSTSSRIAKGKAA